VVVVQSIFRLEIYQNDNFFIFLKIIFEISTSKQFENIKKKIIFSKNIFFEFFRNVGWLAFPNEALVFSLNVFFIMY